MHTSLSTGHCVSHYHGTLAPTNCRHPAEDAPSGTVHDRPGRITRQKSRWTLELLRLTITSGDQVYGSQLAATTLGERCPSAGQGLPLGSWFSQWCGNFYLDSLDHFVKRTLKIPGYQRYMDDFVLFADDKTQLIEARTVIAAWLHKARALDLNPKHLAIEPTHIPAVFLGYRVSRAGISPSRKLRRHLRSRLRVGASRGEEALFRTLQSYRAILLFP
jgi:hypothetical protein